jgi:(p)ppGpp synthase/HD superfamily hydrolase
VTGPDRAEAMGRRLARTARRLGVDEDGRELLHRAFRTAMAPRIARIEDDHHPDYLHPARTALILMDDVRIADPAELAAALLVETRDPSLAASRDAVEDLGAAVTAIVSGVPVPDREGDRLMETLLALPPDILRVAVAERLDHARHLHLRDEAEWRPYHVATDRVYAPVARRVEPTLGARLEWWCDTFTRRFLEA